ncbi:glycosyltransferase family 4 protein [Halorubrum ezzemoulense]|uniref:glycosyltransferase family 4 protein n=1 Tax=Halorubrum ezzemoulense TaxID=337243 RepID=UPI00232ACEAF|nr:glycosyltransferase family 4 protein [Halorubrum ezzemoulense]MDB2225246.1 glycosyltransferase family 4 protein [Halorubrum ezzemoulense]
MQVAYVTPYYNGACDGRYGRFHDWVHAVRDTDDPPFDADVYAFTASNPDEMLVSTPHAYLGEATELWGTKWNKAEFLLNVRRVRKALSVGDYDIVHVLSMDTIVLPTVLSMVPDVPLIIGPDIAGWSPIRVGSFEREKPTVWTKNRLRYLLKNGLSRTVPYDRILAFSEYHRDILETFGIPKECMELIRPGVAERFHPQAEYNSQEPPQLLYVGDFSAHKGYFQFLDALSQLNRSFDARLIGAGDPNIEYIRELGISESVTVEGFVPRADLPTHYRAADVFILPSIDETAGPNTQIEALACGTPVIATDRPGINEYVSDAAAVFFSPRDSDTLTEAIVRALDNLDSLKSGAKRISTSFRAIDTAEALADTYRHVLVES